MADKRPPANEILKRLDKFQVAHNNKSRLAVWDCLAFCLDQNFSPPEWVLRFFHDNMDALLDGKTPWIGRGRLAKPMAEFRVGEEKVFRVTVFELLCNLGISRFKSFQETSDVFFLLSGKFPDRISPVDSETIKKDISAFSKRKQIPYLRFTEIFYSPQQFMALLILDALAQLNLTLLAALPSENNMQTRKQAKFDAESFLSFVSDYLVKVVVNFESLPINVPFKKEFRLPWFLQEAFRMIFLSIGSEEEVGKNNLDPKSQLRGISKLNPEDRLDLLHPLLFRYLPPRG